MSGERQEALAIAPSNYEYMRMTVDDICIQTFDQQVLEGTLTPSVETGMYAAIYRVRADVNAVIHTR
jgi:ribulose-5-phosphate 4-epimerase/fuculose-1-phosphate aldolase